MSDQLNTFLTDFFYQGNTCPSCQKGIEIRNPDETNFVGCIHCNAWLVKKDGKFIKHSKQENTKRKANIDLYSKCALDGATYEVISYRYVKQKNFSYFWKEYVLFNPQRKFLYLAEYDGHWTLLKPVEVGVAPKAPRATSFEWEEKNFRLYNRYQSVTVYALGEFDHDVMVPQSPVYTEYVHPPQILNLERINDNTIHWYVGEYLYPEQIQELFPKALVPLQNGVGANQPFPRNFKMPDFNKLVFASWVLLLAFQLLFSLTASEKVLYKESLNIVDSSGFVAPIVTPRFKIENTLLGRTNVEFKLSAPVSNSWLEIDVNLINDNTDDELSFQEGVEYYYGPGWTEGTTSSTATLSEINDGTYHMVILPYRDPNSNNRVETMELTVIQDVPMWSNFFLIFAAISVYPIFMWIRKSMFESRRWSQSDFGND